MPSPRASRAQRVRTGAISTPWWSEADAGAVSAGQSRPMKRSIAYDSEAISGFPKEHKYHISLYFTG